MGNLSENLCLGVGHLSILLEVIDIAPFSKYHLKFVYLGSYVYRYIKNIFNTIICFQKRHVVFLHPSPSYLTVFLHLCKKLLSAIKISLLKINVKEKQSIHHLKNLKEKTVFLKNSAR